jgi:hypothetical protein
MAAKVFIETASNYTGLSSEEAAALKAAKEEAGKKEEVKEVKVPYTR